jgi:hypothetical protein
MAIVMGVPNRVKRYRIAARMCNWATRRSKSRSAQPFFGTYSIPMPNRRPSTNTLALEKEGVEREQRLCAPDRSSRNASRPPRSRVTWAT